MRFTPKTEEEINLENLADPGDYDFEIQAACESKSKKGNDMIEVKVKFMNADRSWIVTDYLMEAMAFKLRHFCEETQLMHLYDKGALSAADCAGRAGKCQVDIEPAQNGFRAKNRIKDYGPSEPREKAEKDTTKPAQPDAGGGNGSDEPPF